MSTELADLIARGEALRAPLTEAGGPRAAGRLLSARRDLPAPDRELLSWWRDDPVYGVFEVRAGEARPGGAGFIDTLNLIDDLSYRVYGLTLPEPPAAGAFMSGTLLPLNDDDTAWLAAGDELAYPAADAKQVARLAIELATGDPDLVFRNEDKAVQGWEHMRKDREEFLAFFGADELVFPTREAEGRLNEYYRMRRDALASARGRHRQVSDAGETTFVMPPGFFEFDTVGIIYDESEGFVVVPEYGALRELFANPALAEDREHAEVLKAYLNEDAIPPLPLRRIAAACPSAQLDAVYRRALGNRNFAWKANGEALLRKRKPSHFEAEPTPGVAVLSDRVLELARGRKLGAGVLWRGPVRVGLKERVQHRQVTVRGQVPRGRAAVEPRAGDGPVEQFAHRGGTRVGARRRGLDVAQREALDHDAAREDHVLDGPGRIAFAQAESLLQVLVQGALRLAGPGLPFLQRGGDLLPGLVGPGRAQGRGQRHVQPPGQALAERLVVAARTEPGRLAQQRPPPLRSAEQARVAGDDPRDDAGRLRVQGPAAPVPAARACQVHQQVVEEIVLVGPQPVHGTARHPRPLDDLLQPQVLDGQRRARLDGQLPAGVEHALPYFLRRNALRPARHSEDLLPGDKGDIRDDSAIDYSRDMRLSVSKSCGRGTGGAGSHEGESRSCSRAPCLPGRVPGSRVGRFWASMGGIELYRSGGSRRRH